jgi:hypothetical protein
LVRKLITNLKEKPLAFDPEDAVISGETVISDAHEASCFVASNYTSDKSGGFSNGLIS